MTQAAPIISPYYAKVSRVRGVNMLDVVSTGYRRTPVKTIVVDHAPRHVRLNAVESANRAFVITAGGKRVYVVPTGDSTARVYLRERTHGCIAYLPHEYYLTVDRHAFPLLDVGLFLSFLHSRNYDFGLLKGVLNGKGVL